MDPKIYFARLAHDLAQQKAGGVERLEERKIDLQKQLANIDAEIVAAQEASARAASYPITTLGGISCPECWVEGKRTEIRAIGGGTQHFDVFRCDGCNRKSEVPLK